MESANVEDLQCRRLRLRYQMYFGLSVVLVLACLASLGLIVVMLATNIGYEHQPQQPDAQTVRADLFDQRLPEKDQ